MERPRRRACGYGITFLGFHLSHASVTGNTMTRLPIAPQSSKPVKPRRAERLREPNSARNGEAAVGPNARSASRLRGR